MMTKWIGSGLAAVWLAASAAAETNAPVALDEVVRVLRENYVDREKLDATAIDAATVKGILEALGRGAMLLSVEAAPTNAPVAVSLTMTNGSAPATSTPAEPLARAEVIAPNIGYIRLADVSAAAVTALDEELAKFGAANCDGYILDLRFADGSDWAAAAAGASRFSLVTSGRGISSSREKQEILAAVAAIRDAVGIKVCASLGIVDHAFLTDLKAAGVTRFHHNLETAASFFPEICTTHTYEERLATIAAAKKAGLEVCVGGIFGLGESVAQRREMAETIGAVEPAAIPLNFLHPLPGTGLAHRPRLTPLDALKIIAAFRLSFPATTLIICGGRQVTLGSLAPLIFAAGANALMTGDYLTTKGRLPDEDRQMLADLGLELELESGGGEGQGPQAPAPSPAPPPLTP